MTTIAARALHCIPITPFIPLTFPFRRDDGRLLDRPYALSIITAPAPNAGVVKQRNEAGEDRIKETLINRIRNVLSIAAVQSRSSIVLGAYGCGVFKNNPKDVAVLFSKVIQDEGYGKLFKNIVFAIPDRNLCNLFRANIWL